MLGDRKDGRSTRRIEVKTRVMLVLRKGSLLFICAGADAHNDNAMRCKSKGSRNCTCEM